MKRILVLEMVFPRRVLKDRKSRDVAHNVSTTTCLSSRRLGQYGPGQKFYFPETGG
jgi:hypothetical protein